MSKLPETPETENINDFPFTPSPSPSTSRAITTALVWGLDKTSPTMTGFEVEPTIKRVTRDKEPLSLVALSSGIRSSHEKWTTNEIPRI